MKFIYRKYHRLDYPLNVQQDPNYMVFDDYRLPNDLYIADDSEWDTPFNPVKKVRQQSSIISHQYVLKYRGYPVKGYIIFRDVNDRPFDFWDIIAVIRQYLSDVGYKEKYSDKEIRRFTKSLTPSKKMIKKWSKMNRIPPISMTGYFQGVDVSAYCDWYKYLDPSKINGSMSKKANKANLIALYKNVFFTSPFVMGVSSRDRKTKVPVIIQYRDTMALAPKGGLAKLGDIVNQPKLSTAKWDEEDHEKGLISDADYNKFKNDGGFYKNSMRKLLHAPDRKNDYISYAMGDSEITLKYLGFFLKRELEVYHMGLLKRVNIPATLTGLSDEISGHYASLPYYQGQASDTFNSIFNGVNIDHYLRPLRYNQRPTNYTDEWANVIDTIVHVRNAKTDDEFQKRVEQQKYVLNKLRSFLSRNSVNWGISVAGNCYQYLPSDFEDCINFEKFEQLNPKINPSTLLNCSGVSIRHFHPDFTNVSQNLCSNFAKNSYRFVRNSKNELPSLTDILTYLWGKSLYANYHEHDNVTDTPILVSVSPSYWLARKLDFQFVRRGYHFEEPDKAVSKHESNAHDLPSVRPDTTYNQGFEMARRAYMGGMNLCYCPGILMFIHTYDVDLKSSYVNAGHLIPDFRLDVLPWLDKTDISLSYFLNSIKPSLPNGVFTLGVCDIDYQLPKGIRRVPVGVKADVKGATPRYVLGHSRACLMLTDVFDLIEHGASIFFHRIIIPHQKKLNGSFESLSPVGKMQDWSLTQRNAAKKKYGKKSPEQEFAKLLGNGGYGKTGQGLNEKVSRNFGDGQTYFVPFSRSTNPFLAAQYTAIARYQVNFLMDLMNDLYPGSVVPSVTTDGFIFCSQSAVNKSQLLTALRSRAPRQWVTVNDKWFNGEFFEFKSKLKHDTQFGSINSPLVNLKTRFNFTLDGRIEAMTGVKNIPFSEVYDCIKDDQIVLDVESSRMSSLVDMKHRTDYQHLMNEWDQITKLSLGYDDTYKLTIFHDNGDGFGWYESEPFSTVDEVEAYRDDMKPYRKLFPLFNSEYAKAFLNFDDRVTDINGNKHIIWIADDVKSSLIASNYDDLLDRYRNNYAPSVFMRYLNQNEDKFDLHAIYDDLFKTVYKTFSGFHQAVNRATGFVNKLVVLKENWDQDLAQYKTMNTNRE